jgi:ComF family protein
MRQAGTAVLYDADCVVPVPLHARRRRLRGFNQAAELAAQLKRPVVHALRRIVATRPQAELPAASRYRNVAKAFAPARAIGWRPAVSQIRGARVVIVDDVVTTGATVEACAGVLRSLAAREVRVLTLARVGRSRSP